MPTVLENRRQSLAEELAGIVTEAETRMARDDFNPESTEYVALRENRERTEAQLADTIATINARNLSISPAPAGRDERGDTITEFRRILREFDRGHSDVAHLEYQIQRAYQVLTTNPESGSAMFTPTPTRIQVETLPIYTPTLDSIRTVPTGGTYDFVVPPPPVAAVTVPENTPKPAVEFTSARVAGTLETDAHILDVSRQTLEDDATAERTLRGWLVEGVKIKQDSKSAVAIAGATGTLTATGSTTLGSIRQGKAELSKIGIRATTVYLHPDDAAAADVEAMITAHTGPNTNPTLWSMQVIENPSIVAGTAIVGALPQAVYLCYRSSIATYLTDSGNTVETVPRDRFSNNILGVLGEGRSKVHVVQPQLLVKCTVVTVP